MDQRAVPVRQSITAISLWVAVLICGYVSAVNAAQVSGQFNVKVNLQNTNSPAAPRTGFCVKRTGLARFGATVTVVCSTGAVVDIFADPWMYYRVGAYRYLFQLSSGAELLGTINSYADVGSETSWRVINLTDRKYLEMQVGW